MASTRDCPYLGRVVTQYRLPKLETRREYFRLPYPITSGATLDIAGANYKVGEISERGLRVVSGVGRFPVDARIEGTFTFAMGTRCAVRGTVLRIDEDSFIVRLERALTSQDILREQRFVARQFPDWKPVPA